mmetsp:Transcript_47263/g.109363  ORF Transcript_47263/g.109363 Transcript_47263/m.109363 type:complete len:229 (-) Transcript_47263:204-890(-)
MVLALIFCLAPALLTLAVANSVASAQDTCRSLLQDLGSRGFADVELAAYCRANAPPQVCRDASSMLGSQPWTSERMGAACRKWEDDARKAAPGREAWSPQDLAVLQQKVDQCMKEKANVGLCKDPTTGGSVPVDQCISYKLQEYPKQAQKVQEAIQKIFAAATQVPQSPRPQSKAAWTGPVLISSRSLAPYVGAAALAVLLVSGMMAAVRRARRVSEHRHALVSANDA